MMSPFWSTLIVALTRLAWLGFIGCVPAAAYLWLRGRHLSHMAENETEAVRSLVDWHQGDTLRRRSYIVICIVAPILFFLANVLSGDRPCMAPGEIGALVASTSESSAGRVDMYATFRMGDGSHVMCHIRGMNAAGMVINGRYRVPGGVRMGE